MNMYQVNSRTAIRDYMDAVRKGDKSMMAFHLSNVKAKQIELSHFNKSI